MWSCASTFFIPGARPYLAGESLKKCDRDTHPKPYIFMIRVTREIKLHYSSGPRVIPHPLPKLNFLMVEIPTPKPYIFMIRVNRPIKCPKSWELHISRETILSILTNFVQMFLGWSSSKVMFSMSGVQRRAQEIYFLSSETWWYLE